MENEKVTESPFTIYGDDSLTDFLKYLEAVGVKYGNKAFWGLLNNQIKAYHFTVNGENGLWTVCPLQRGGKDGSDKK